MGEWVVGKARKVEHCERKWQVERKRRNGGEDGGSLVALRWTSLASKGDVERDGEEGGVA